MTASSLGQLIGRVYDAGFGSESWEHMLADVSRASGGFAAALNVRSAGTMIDSISLMVGLDPACLQQYNEHYHKVNIHIRRGLPVCPPDRLIPSHSFVSDADVFASEHYNGWLRPQGLFHLLGGVLSSQPATASLLAFLRPFEPGPFTESHIATGEMLMPHLSRALQINRRLETLNQGLEALDHLPCAVFLLSNSGEVLLSNRGARQILARFDGFTLTAHGRLTAMFGQASRLQKFFSTAAEPCHCAPLGHLSIQRKNGLQPYSVSCLPVRSGHSIARSDLPALSVYVFDPDTKQPFDALLLQQRFNLTSAETRVAKLLSEGYTIKTICSRLRVKVTTVRTHVQHLHDKLAVKHHGELMAVLLHYSRAARIR